MPTQDFKGTINGNTITAGTGIVTISAGKTITATQDTTLDEAVAMSSKAPKASPTFTVGVGIGGVAAGLGGIAFPATAVSIADVNTLDDYEEGTWTPGLLCGTSGTITVDTGASLCLYTKIGRFVSLTGYVSVTSVSSPVGRLRLTGLPFSQVTGGRPVGTIYTTTTNAYTGIPICLGNEATAIFIDRNAGTGADPATDLAAAIKAATEFYFTFTYTAAT